MKYWHSYLAQEGSEVTAQVSDPLVIGSEHRLSDGFSRDGGPNKEGKSGSPNGACGINDASLCLFCSFAPLFFFSFLFLLNA